MESEIIGSLLDFGMGGIFIAFMIWQWIASQKKSEKQVEKFMTSLDTIRKEHQEAQDTLRERYDVVINNYNEERTIIRSNIAGRVEKIIGDLKNVSEGVDKLMVDSVASGEQMSDISLVVTNLKSQIEDLLGRLKTMESNISSGLLLMQDIQQEAKLKEVARAMVAESRKDT